MRSMHRGERSRLQEMERESAPRARKWVASLYSDVLRGWVIFGGKTGRCADNFLTQDGGEATNSTLPFLVGQGPFPKI